LRVLPVSKTVAAKPVASGGGIDYCMVAKRRIMEVVVIDLKRHEEIFRTRFDGPAEIIVRAPGRVELIGNHTDYNDGFVLPMAIDRQCLVLARRRTDRKVRVYSELFRETAEFDMDPDLRPGQPAWANYGKGVMALLLKAGKKPTGLDIALTCDVPSGGGLSSSAAIEVAYAKAFLAASGETFDPVELALLCQQAEHTYAGAPCGIMDQFICVLGKAGHALLLDCRTRKYELVPVPFQHASILIADTKVKHDLGQSGYPLRRKQCFEVVDVLKKDLPNVTHLRDIDLKTLDGYRSRLDEIHYKRARHILTENERVMTMAEGFRTNDLALAGRMMSASHASSRDDYDVSCEELDFMVREVGGYTGVYGARMSGGGFGGCMVALVENRHAPDIQKKLSDAYNRKYGTVPAIFFTGAAAGAEVLKA
jgi:galactokinase